MALPWNGGRNTQFKSKHCGRFVFLHIRIAEEECLAAPYTGEAEKTWGSS